MREHFSDSTSNQFNDDNSVKSKTKSTWSKLEKWKFLPKIELTHNDSEISDEDQIKKEKNGEEFKMVTDNIKKMKYRGGINSFKTDLAEIVDKRIKNNNKYLSDLLNQKLENLMNALDQKNSPNPFIQKN